MLGRKIRLSFNSSLGNFLIGASVVGEESESVKSMLVCYSKDGITKEAREGA